MKLIKKKKNLPPATHLSMLLSLGLYCAGVMGLNAQDGSAGDNDDVRELSPFEVTGENEVGYSTVDSVGATRISTNILEVDHSVTSLNKELLSDINSPDLAGALTYVSGVGKSSSTENDSVTMRGVEGAATFFDGLPNAARPSNVKYPMTGIERIEVVKGPAGALYGAVSGNGLINYIMKRPTPEPTGSIKATGTVGSFSNFHAEIDVGGRLMESKLGYRVAAAFREGNRKEGLPWDTQSLYANFDHYVNDNLRLWFTSEYWHNDVALVQNSFRAAPVDPDGDPLVRGLGLNSLLDAESFYGDDDATAESDNFRIEFGGESTFDVLSNTWTARTVVRYGQVDYFRRTVVGNNYDFLAADGTVLGNQNNFTFENPGWVEIQTRDTFLNTVKQDFEPFGAFFDLTGGFQVGPTDHTFLTFVQYERTDSFFGQVQYNMNPVRMINPEDMDISVKFDQMENLPSDLTGVRAVRRRRTTRNDNFRFGISDTMRIFDGKLILLGGANYTYESPSTFVDTTENPEEPVVTVDESTQDWTFKYSAVGRPLDWLSIFATHSETFTPMTGSNILNEPFRNRSFESDEVGIKFNYDNGLVTGTISYFDSSEDGFITREVQPDGTQVDKQNGVAVFDGVEADVAVNLGGFHGLFAVSKVDALTDTGAYHRGGNQGWNWSLFTKYDFTNGGKLDGLSVGAGVRRESRRIGDGNNTFWVPGYEVVDLLASYGRGNWKVQANIFNLTDEHYVLTAVNRNNVYFGDPLNARLSFEYSF